MSILNFLPSLRRALSREEETPYSYEEAKETYRKLKKKVDDIEQYLKKFPRSFISFFIAMREKNENYIIRITQKQGKLRYVTVNSITDLQPLNPIKLEEYTPEWELVYYNGIIYSMNKIESIMQWAYDPKIKEYDWITIYPKGD